MGNILIALVAGLILVGGGLVATHKVALPNFTRSVSVHQNSTTLNSVQGKVAGIFTTIGSTATQVADTGSTVATSLAKVLTSSPSAQSDVIDVSAAVQQISSRVQSLPSTIAQQARLVYCRQVLLEATASATKK